MKRHEGRIVLSALAMAVALAGCWGSEKSTSLDLTSGANVLAGATAVGIDKCHDCHADTAVNGVRIFDGWAASRHANLDNSFDAYDNSLGATPVYHGSNPTCTEFCHDPNGDSANLTKYIGPGSSTTTRSVIGCEACHGGGSLHFGVGPIGGPTLGIYAIAASTDRSSQYNTCTGCHNDTEHTTLSYRLIGDTHTENTARLRTDNIAGYIIRKNKNTACTDCHLSHQFDLTANRQWKASGHADFTSAAWYDEGIRYTGNALAYDRCQRCHTPTGFVKYATNHTDNLALADFTADGVSTDNAGQVMYCWGCHGVDSGGMTVARRTVQDARIPGAWDNGQVFYSSTASLNSYTTITGKGDSEICMNCHSSRPGRNGFFILSYLTTEGRGYDNTAYGGPTPHYLVAVQTLFQDNTKGIGGYALPGKDYTDSDFEHNTIGGSTSGPCVGCHMSSPSVAGDVTTGKHSFLPFTYNDDGTIKAITSTKCVECHDGTTAAVLSVSGLNALKALTTARVEAFRDALRAQGIYPNANGDKFYSTALGASQDNTSSLYIKNWNTRAVAIGGIDGYDLFGIAHNYNYLNKEAAEPGSWAHNNVYVNRLIFDAITALKGTPGFARP